MGAGWLLFLVGNYFDYHILTILQSMTAATTGSENSETGVLLSSALPAWTKIDLARYLDNRPMLARCFLTSTTTVTKQDTLYWLERKGPKLCSIIFQIQLVFTSAYVSLLILSFYPFMLNKSDLAVSMSYVVVSLLPVYLLLSKYESAAANMTIACSIGVHRRPQAVSQVIREGKTDRIIRAMVTMQKLQDAVHSGFSSTPPTGAPPMDPHQLAEISNTFDAFDNSGDGRIETSEMKNILKALGAAATPEVLATIVQTLDKNNDGHISRDEFIAFCSANIRLEHDHHGLHELAHHMFRQFDQDGSGEITLGEFKTVLDAFNVGFSVDEIGDLVNALDEQHNGTIGEHEFLELLETHYHLFQRSKLPPLE